MNLRSRLRIGVIGLGSWDIKGVTRAATAEEAVWLALKRRP
ncbi:MAG: hypothetical protein NTU60_08820 [Candidatus Aminicenantes bacterium]|nr:hypothetical protein [Candidatus Aminicenantes bacterium]